MNNNTLNTQPKSLISKDKDKDTEIIFSAGEVATYAFCPENWNLQYCTPKENLQQTMSNSNYFNSHGSHHSQLPENNHNDINYGIKLHNKWSKDWYEAIFLTQGTRIVVMIIILAILFVLLPFTFK